jgi:DNA ligase 1
MVEEKLYKLDKTGEIRIWWAEIDKKGGKYRTHSGLENGAITTSDWTQCFGKNEGKKNATKPSEQAEKEVMALVKKKKKGGYISDPKKLVTAFKPMLAKKYADYSHKIDFCKETWYLQCKFNGARCVYTKDGAFSRTGERFLTVDHIMEALKPWFDKHPESVLDGELFNYDYREKLNELMKLVRKTVHISDEDLKQSRKLVKYYIYDGFGFGGMSHMEHYDTRKNYIDEYLYNILYDLEGPVCPVEQTAIESPAHFYSIYQDLLDEGHEGGMLRKAESPYEFGRSKYLLKVKPEDDDEFVITGIREGTGNWAGKAKIIDLTDPNMGDFSATFKGDMSQAAQLLKDKKKWIGKKVTIKYFGLTGLGTPNYAQFDIDNQPHSED